MGIWKAIPMFTNTLSCAGTSTLVGLYKSRPTDFGIAHVGIHAVGNNFIHREALWPQYLLFCYAIVIAQLVCPIYLYTKKYLKNICTILKYTYTRVHEFKSFSFKAL